jgi:suppressor for copper-sensitivity B
MKGVLATLLATPCTAPFLASAVSFALASSVVVTLMIFTAAGVGWLFPMCC